MEGGDQDDSPSCHDQRSSPEQQEEPRSEGHPDYQRTLNGEPQPSSPFEFDDYFNYRVSGMDYNQYYNLDYYNQNSDSNSDEEGTAQHQRAGGVSYGIDAARESQHMFGDVFESDGAYARRLGGQSSNTEEVEGVRKGSEVEAVDPGPFQYNKRVFITALPCLLLTLIMTGETLLLMVTIGGLLIVLMAHWGGDVSKRCVVVFALLFIPSHILVVGTVLPLLWLSVWNLLLIALVNFFCVLTGGWVIVQFEAFRKEELEMCAMIERVLFSAYPLVCSALVTWVLSTVVFPPVTPFLFICIWFVCLQLYLMPAVTSFRQTDREEGGEDLTVLPQPIVMALILAFTISGPALHTVLTVAGYSALKFWSLPSLALLAMLVCLGLFLATLLNLRQLCDHWGWRHSLVVQMRWGSGAGAVLLCYPVLQQQGVVSHLLLSLPLAVGCFSGLGVSLNLKRERVRKVLPIILMALLMLLLCVWLNQLPWTLTYYLLGGVPLKAFHGVVAANFVLCTVAIYTSWHSSKEALGSLLLLQSIGQTVCELGLYQAGLFSSPALQLTGVVAAYTLHRLYLASKLTRVTAALTSAVQLTKTVLGALSYLLKEVGERGGQQQGGALTAVDVSMADFLTLLLLVGVVVWLFVYETKEEVTVLQAGKHVTALMGSLAVSAQSFLLPLGDFLLQEDPTMADLVGLWYGLGGVLMLLYCLQHWMSEGLADQLMKGALVMGGVGALVMSMQPQFTLTLYALCQWCEVLSVLLVAALLTTRVDMGLTKILITASLLAICPGIHATIILYGDIVTVLHFVIVSALSCQLLALMFMVVKMEEVTEAVEKVIQIGAVLMLSLIVAVVAVDVVNFEYLDSVWDYPAWTMLLAVSAVVSVCLKGLALKLGPHQLPLVKKEVQSILPEVPVISNVFTVMAFLLAATQGPFNPLLHDLWVCAASLILTCLQRDPLLLSSLSPANRATPTIMAAVGTLVLSTLTQSRLWHPELGGWSWGWGVLLGLLEVVTVLASLPVYVVLAGVLWRGKVRWEKGVVFGVPLNALLVVLGTGFTAWLLCLAGLVSGLGLMLFRLPMLPNNF